VLHILIKRIHTNILFLNHIFLLNGLKNIKPLKKKRDKSRKVLVFKLTFNQNGQIGLFTLCAAKKVRWIALFFSVVFLYLIEFKSFKLFHHA